MTPYYDSLLCKIIVHGEDRPAALAKMRTALSNCEIGGLETNLTVHRQLLEDAEFTQGGVDTAYFPRLIGTMAMDGGRDV